MNKNLMTNFKFELETEVSYKQELLVVIGRSQFIKQTNRYLCQDIISYGKIGFNFLNGQWLAEYEIKKV